jgi:hypothetical protein
MFLSPSMFNWFSAAAYYSRHLAETGLPTRLAGRPGDDRCRAARAVLAAALLGRVGDAASEQAHRRTQILPRGIGDMVRVKHRGVGGAEHDVISHILGRSFTLHADGHLTCTWTLARVFTSEEAWRPGS